MLLWQRSIVEIDHGVFRVFFLSIFYMKITRYFWFFHILTLVIYQTPLKFRKGP